MMQIRGSHLQSAEVLGATQTRRHDCYNPNAAPQGTWHRDIPTYLEIFSRRESIFACQVE